MTSFSTEDEQLIDLTPAPEILNAAQHATEILIPKKSREKDLAAYDSFLQWKSKKNTQYCQYTFVVSSQVPFWNDLAPLTYQHHWDNTAHAVLRNDGIGVHLQLKDFNNVPSIYGGPLVGTYHFHRVNFYWGLDNATAAYHLIGNDPIAMEVHTSYFNSNCEVPAQVTSDAWTVVSTRFTEGAPNAAFQMIAESVKAINNPYSSIVLKSDFLSWLKRPQMDRGYVTYNAEQIEARKVTWIIYIDPVTISKAQVDVFRTITNGDGALVKENLCKLPITPINKEIVVVKEIPFVPVVLRDLLKTPSDD